MALSPLNSRLREICSEAASSCTWNSTACNGVPYRPQQRHSLNFHRAEAVLSARLQGLDRSCFFAAAAQGDQRHLRCTVAQRRELLNPIGAGRLDVHEHQIDVVGKLAERLVELSGRDDCGAVTHAGRQHAFEASSGSVILADYQYSMRSTWHLPWWPRLGNMIWQSNRGFPRPPARSSFEPFEPTKDRQGESLPCIGRDRAFADRRRWHKKSCGGYPVSR